MPVIDIEMDDLYALLGREVGPQGIMDAVSQIGAEIEAVQGNLLHVMFSPNRPDLYSVEGIARALRGFLGIETGAPLLSSSSSHIEVMVEPSVPDVRPYIVCGVVKGVEMSDALIRSLMSLQEKLHLTLGRRRKKVAIGVHDMAGLKPPFTYKGVEPQEVRFIPLGMTEEMNLAEVLQRHEKGREFAFTLERAPRYPIILDALQQVLSFPPIINGTVTEVTEDTRDIFLDVTGTEMRAMDAALNVITYVLADRGGTVETVGIAYPERRIVRPDPSPTRMELDTRWALGLIGTTATMVEAQTALQRMRLGAEPKGERLEVLLPPYRSDILHPVDIVEDLAIGLGYAHLPSILPRENTIGSVRGIERCSEKAAQALVGYGYLEVTTLTLTREEEQAAAHGYRPSEVTRILNPIVEEHDCLRISLLPGLLQVLRGNKHRHLPQRVFEVGDVLRRYVNRRYCAGISIHPEANFTEGRSLVLGLMRDLGHQDVEFERGSAAIFMQGRCAVVSVAEHKIGVCGEIAPDVLTSHELVNPAMGFEIDIMRLQGLDGS
ncbi:MAG: phenylalanine--tRNA ligase subunit beta [Candidatus Thermoplasmatota archaeon]